MNDYFLSIDKTKFENFGSLSWSDDLENYTTIIKFSSQRPFNVGRQFILNNGTNQLYRGIITDVNYDRELIYNYIAYDYGFYLSKNEVTIEFSNIEIERAIKNLLFSVKIPSGIIEEVRGTVDDKFKKKTVKHVLENLLSLASKQTGIKYVVDCSLGAINIRPVYKINDVKGELAENFYINSAENLGNVKITNSIQELKNKVLIYKGDDKNSNVVYWKDEPDSISKYGILQEIVEVDNNVNNYSILAQNTLLDRNRVKTTIEADFLGDDRIKKGVIISIRDTVVNVVGDYLVKTSEHTIENGKHTVHCLLELYQ